MAKERVFFTRWHTVTSCIELVQRVYRLLKGFLLGFLFYSASFLKSKFGRGSIEVFFFYIDLHVLACSSCWCDQKKIKWNNIGRAWSPLSQFIDYKLFFIFPSLGLIECHWSFQFFFFFAGIDSLINRKWPSSELFPSLVKESLLLGEFLDPIFSLCMCLYLCLWIFSPREQFYGGKSFGVCVYQTKQLWLNHTP